jgi:iron complex outermembrane recepter protein
MRKLVTIMLFFSLQMAVMAQTGKGKITGSVIDGSTKTIESATITLLRVSDSSVVKMGVADKTGKYVFENIGDGKYIVSVTAVGHAKGYSEVAEINSSTTAVELKTLELVPVSKSLGAVTVTARKPLIEQKIDRTIVNVEASITNAGNSAMEVLEKSPGITVDKDGNISLKGKSGVMVMIDGRPSNLGGADLAALLRSMNANQLDQIEIMTNPPAKYDAAGNSGIINIKTKKNKQFGYNGSLTSGYTQGRYARFNESVNFNYRSGKVNLFTNLNYNRNHRGEDLDIVRNFRDPATKNILSVFDQKTEMVNQGHFFSGKLGLDYFASKKTTIGFVLNGFSNDRLWKSTSSTNILNPDGSLESITKALARNESDWKNFSGNAYFKTILDTTGQELTADFDYAQYNSTIQLPLYSSYYDKFGNLKKATDTLVGSLPQNIRIYSVKMDYVLPLKKGAKFEAGFKSSYVKTDNNANYDTLRNGEVIHDFNRSNHFVYEENINAVYVNYSRPLGKKWNGQFGLRMENTNAKGDQLTTNVQFKRNYTQLFPTTYLQYIANEKNSFVLNYGRRINRPNYENLNPFIEFIDRYTFEQGNPNLKPQFSHNVELSHTYRDFLTTTLNYSRTTDIIQQVLEQNELTNETFIKQANIASQQQFGISVSANAPVNKWWTTSVYANFAHNQYKGVVNNENISIGLPMFMTQLQQQFKWGKGWSAEVSGVYRSKAVEGVIFIKPIAQVGAGFSKVVLKGKGTIRLNARDIFNGSKFKGYSKYGTVDAEFVNVNDNRSVGISFTWRFNKGKLKANSGKREGGASEEQNRVGGGN